MQGSGGDGDQGLCLGLCFDASVSAIVLQRFNMTASPYDLSDEIALVSFTPYVLVPRS